MTAEIKLSPVARGLMVRAVRARAAAEREHDLELSWIRADAILRGERPSLASLWRKGLLERRAHRLGRNSADNAYEYRLTDLGWETIQAAVAARAET